MKTTEITTVLYKAVQVYYGSWKTALTTLGITQETSKLTQTKRTWTEDSLCTELRKHLDKGQSKTYISKNHTRLYNAILRNYGSIEHFSEVVGIDLSIYENIKPKTNYRKIDKVTFNENGIMSKQDTEKFVSKLIDNYNAADIITTRTLTVDYPQEYLAIRKHYGSVANAFTSNGRYILDKKVPKRWSKEFLISQLQLGYTLNEQLNTEYVTKYASSAEEYARKAYGSWRKALEFAEIPKQYYELDSQESARAGHIFESVLGEILTDLGVEFTKYTHEKYKPDFVSGAHWIDAKLSLWTVNSHNKGTIKNYEPYCERLTVVFLRGRCDYDTMVTDKTRVVNVYKLMEGLSKERADCYQRKLDAILDALKENAA